MNGKTSSVFQRLLAATLLVSGLGAIAAPAFADGTAAGTLIDNTATATYDNPDDVTKPFNATSNKVTVTVAEVAGVTVTPLSTIDRNGGTVGTNDIVDYEFKVTNVGNDTTGLFIPGAPVVSGPGSATQVQIVAYIDSNGVRTNLTTAITIAPTGENTTALTALPSLLTFPAGIIPAGYSLVVSVPTTINNLAASGADVVVRVGNTAPNDNSPATQNQPAPTAASDLIRTVDYGTEPNDPLLQAQEKQASATQTVKVGSTSQALATILKTRTSYAAGDPNALNDDVIGYGLRLKVESSAPLGSVGITPGKLVGTDITVNGSATKVNRILISDVIPALTKLTLVTDVASPSPSLWIPVYTDSLLTTPAVAANWSTAFNANATRIGFIYDATTTPLVEGSDITGFSFKVVTSGVTGTSPVNVLNIAQVFGQTQGNTGPTAPLVYDESGDKNPSNFNDNGTPGNTATLTPGSPPANIPSGVPNATNDGVDNNNDNTGQGPGGEDNVTTIAVPGTILNGPSGLPSAVGPTNNNDDFTNRSTPIPANTLPGATFDPDPVTFTNTLSNPSTAPLSNVLLVPDVAGFVPTAGDQLPLTGTTVTLTYGNIQPAVYRFDGTNFIFISGGSIIIPTLAAGEAVNYTVSVDLPATTPLSTDTGKGFSIPIFAFIDGTSGLGSNDSRPSTGEVQNRTIDRVYTGFLKLLKEVALVNAQGVVGAYTSDGSTLKPGPGMGLQYRITYTNISIAPTGTGNVILDAKNILITENGDNGSNSWAKQSNGLINTSHVLNSVVVTYGGPLSTTYLPSGERTGKTQAADVTTYEHKPGVIIQPQATGTFIFQRKIN